MLKRFQRALTELPVDLREQTVLVAVSGGADSMALLDLMARSARRFHMTVVVAHLNHGLRGRESLTDARAVKARAKDDGLAVVVGRSDVAAMAKTQGVSIEMAARDARYAFFRRTAKRVGAVAVLVAHSMDDQAETVLLKISRGAGLRGAAGMRPSTRREGLQILRPLLGFERAELRRYLKRRKLDWREDPSNTDTAMRRNFMRHRILPELQAGVNPGVVAAIARFAHLAQEDDAFLSEMTQALLADCVDAPGVLAADRLGALPLAARRRVLLAWLDDLGISLSEITASGLAQIDRLAETMWGTQDIEIGPVRIRRTYGTIELVGTETQVARYRRRLKRDGVTDLPELGFAVHVSRGSSIIREQGGGPGCVPATASISAERLGRAGLFVRAPQAGDRMRPYGMRGTRKLQDIFVDARVAKHERARVPVVEACGEIVWIPGYRIAEGWQVTEGEPAIVLRIAATD